MEGAEIAACWWDGAQPADWHGRGIAICRCQAERGRNPKEEREAAGRFVRWILEFHVPGAEVVREPGGRPRLKQEGWDFNLSHSGKWWVVALRRGGRVGVDVEEQRETRDMEEIATRFFDPEEGERVRNGGVACFYHLWTVKEAALKCVGMGLSGGLDRTRPTPDGNVVMPDGGRLAYRTFALDAQHCGAVVWGGGPEDIFFFDGTQAFRADRDRLKS